MDTSTLTELLPLGGASVLLIYLLRLISYERARWIRERATLIEECRTAVALKDADIERRERDHEKHLEQWRERYDIARADYETLLQIRRRDLEMRDKE